MTCSIKMDDPCFKQGWLFCAWSGQQHGNLQTSGEPQQGERVRLLRNTCISTLIWGTFNPHFLFQQVIIIISDMMQPVLEWSWNESVFSFSAMRYLEWRSWLTTGLFTTATAASSGRRWAGCWAWRQRRSAAGRKLGKPWRKGRERLTSTLWYDYYNHWLDWVYKCIKFIM